ncbi:hypothetical protein C6Y02_17250 [Bacillus sp. NMCC4]|uniref:hypothetical protein n=1 Tax=Bacillus sp. NMCC4 TaxID=2108539 RepID=UPI000D040BE4|nr:hypothetical protein [Bacillus sp. NMCC4]PRS35758.1 hypothetical protein C6Y02_17250 [Bacillus sp. NMCC4]
MKNKQYSVKIEVEVGFTSHQEAKEGGIQDISELIAYGSIEADVREIHNELNTIQMNEKLVGVQSRIKALKDISIFNRDGLETELKYLDKAIQKLKEGDQQALTVIEYIRLLTYNDDLFDLSTDVLKRFE